MKHLIPFFAGLVLASAPINASDIYHGVENGNADLYSGAGNTMPLAVQPGTGDFYGGSSFDHTQLKGLVDTKAAQRQPSIYNGVAEGNIDLE